MKPTTPRLYLSPPHMGGMEEAFVHDAFASNWIAPLGPHVDAFELECAATAGRKGGAALSSGTAAIHLALKLLGVTRGDYVLCSSLTFSGSCNPILYEGAIPVFIDSERTTWNMDPALLDEAIMELKKQGIRCKAAIVVDLYGQSADYGRILPILERERIPMIEDAAEALGASYRGHPCGSFGALGILSFNGNKIITTSGGGMLLANDENLLRKARFWATQARDPAPHYEHSELGYNYRMSNVVAAIGRGQLEVLEERVRRKREINFFYREALKDIAGLDFMPVAEPGEPNYWLTVVTVADGAGFSPKQVMDALDAENIESRPVWKPMHLQKVFQIEHADPGRSPSENAGNAPPYPALAFGGDVAEDLFRRGVCLPSGTAMCNTDLERVCHIIKSFIASRVSGCCQKSEECGSDVFT